MNSRFSSALRLRAVPKLIPSTRRPVGSAGVNEALDAVSAFGKASSTRPAMTVNDLSPLHRRLLHAFNQLPEDEAERQIRRLALMRKAKDTHDAIMEVSRPEGMLSTYRSMLARHLSEVDAAMGDGQQPDAELLALSREFEDAWANERHLAGSVDTEEEWEAAVAATGALVDRIATIPAATLTGLKVKAHALLWCSSGHDKPGPEMFGSTTDLQLAGTIIRDLLNMGGKA